MKITAMTIALAVAGGVALPNLGSGRAEEPAPKITLALVGTAHVHTPGFVRRVTEGRHDVRVKYVWDHDVERAKRFAAALHAQVADSAEQVFSDPEVAGVAIYAETNRHHDLVLAAAKAHKHLYVEKPLGMNGKECDEMAAAIEQAGVVFTTGYFNRCLPAHLFLKDQIAKGNLGKITRVRASLAHNAAIAGWFLRENQWFADPKAAGVGGFGDMGTHMLDLLMWMFGDVQSVTADIKAAVGRYGDTDDCGEALFRFKNGVTATLAAGWADVDNPVTLEIAGTEGHAVIFRDKLYFKSSKVPGADGQKPWTDLPEGLPHPADLFMDAVGGKAGLPLVTPREAATRVRVMDAMYEASKKHAWVAPE